MAESLTKVHRSGEVYHRPPPIEEAINRALAQDLPTCLRRAECRSRADPEWLAPEVLVHLIRQAGRNNDVQGMNLLLPHLLERTEALIHRICWFHGGEPAGVLEAALGELLLLFLEERDQGRPHEQLDYFEVRFPGALAALVVDLLRKEGRRKRLTEDVPRYGEDGTALSEDDALSHAAHPDDLPRATQLEYVQCGELLTALSTLPKHERKAYEFVQILGCKVESKDPMEPTAAKLMGVTGRTIRNWLTQAKKKLRSLIRESK